MTACQIKTAGKRKYRCHFELALQVIGGKWKPIILYQLAVEGVLRFGELRRSVEGITERMLTRQLRELESDGLIKRKVYRQVPPKVEYSLEPFGVRLIPILLQMREWGQGYEIFLNKEIDNTFTTYSTSKGECGVASMYQEQLKRENLAV